MESAALFTVGQKSLLASMSKIRKFLEQKAVISYMDYVYFESDGEKIWFSASDIENTATMELDGVRKISGAFKICVEKNFLLPLGNLECDISFELNGDVCTVLSLDGRVTVPVLGADSFPRPSKELEKIFLMPEGTLLDIIRTFIPFVHHDPLSSCNSLHFRFQGGNLRIGAYDGVICAATEVRMQPLKEHSFMVSGKSASMVGGLLENGGDKMCTVSLSRNDIVFRTDGGVVSCRQMAYNNMLVPNDYFSMGMPYVSKEADVMGIGDKGHFMKQLRKATVFNTRANQVVVLKLERNKVVMEVEDALLGRRSVQECFVTFKHEGGTERALVNCNKFMTMLGGIPEDAFELRVPLENGPGQNCIGIPLSVVSGRYIFIIATLTD